MNLSNDSYQSSSPITAVSHDRVMTHLTQHKGLDLDRGGFGTATYKFLHMFHVPVNPFLDIFGPSVRVSKSLGCSGARKHIRVPHPPLLLPPAQRVHLNSVIQDTDAVNNFALRLILTSSVTWSFCRHGSTMK